MTTPAYLLIEGERQGLLTKGALAQSSVGNKNQTEQEDEILVQAFIHALWVPTDTQSGQPAGQSGHSPLMTTKTMVKSTPLLYVALTTGERLTKCELKLYRVSASGHQQHYFTIKLEGGIVTKMKSDLPNCQDPICSQLLHLEHVAITYRKIHWEHVVAGTSGTYDRSASNSSGNHWGGHATSQNIPSLVDLEALSKRTGTIDGNVGGVTLE